MWKMIYVGSRRFLPPDSPMRARKCGEYEFMDEERRPPAPERTTTMMKDCLRVLSAPDHTPNHTTYHISHSYHMPLTITQTIPHIITQVAKEEDLAHVCGFAGPAMFSKRVDFDFKADNIPDWMHNLGRVFIMVLEVICGGHGANSRAARWTGRDAKHRAECELFGIFPSTWVGQRQLPDDVRSVLRQVTDDQIDSATRVSLERWSRAVGQRTNGVLVEDLRRRVFEFMRRVRLPDPFFYIPLKPSPLPWRLTADAFAQVDERITNMVFPHGTETLRREGRYHPHPPTTSSRSSPITFDCREIFSACVSCCLQDCSKAADSDDNLTHCAARIYTGV